MEREGRELQEAWADLETAPSKMELFKQICKSVFIRRSDIFPDLDEPGSLITKSEKRSARRATFTRKSAMQFRLRAVSEPILHYWEIIPDVDLEDLKKQQIDSRRDTFSATKVLLVKPKIPVTKSQLFDVADRKNICAAYFEKPLAGSISDDIEFMSSLKLPITARGCPDHSAVEQPSTCLLSVSEDGSQMIRGGSLNAIIQQVLTWLVDSSDSQQRNAAMEFLDIILLTFVRHADALGLLDTVTHIYFASPNLRAGAVMLFLKWIERRPADFIDQELNPTPVYLKFQEFLDSLSDSSAKQVLTTKLRALRTGKRKLAKLYRGIEPSPKLTRRRGSRVKKDKALPSNFEFIDLQPLEVAEQLTVLDLKVLKKVSLNELVFNNENVAEHVQKQGPVTARGHVNMAIASIGAFAYLSNRWNKVSGWVASEILTTAALKQRAEVIKRFIALGEHLVELRNYHSLMAVLSGLNKPAISRLKKTWKQIATKHHEKLKALETIMTFNNNYETYRGLLKQHLVRGEAMIPFVALYTRDLTFVNENPEYLDKAKTIINFEKLYLIGKIVGQVRDQQGSSYPELKDTKHSKRGTEIRQYLAKLSNTFDDDVLYKMSQRCEEGRREA